MQFAACASACAAHSVLCAPSCHLVREDLDRQDHPRRDLCLKGYTGFVEYDLCLKGYTCFVEYDLGVLHV